MDQRGRKGEFLHSARFSGYVADVLRSPHADLLRRRLGSRHDGALQFSLRGLLSRSLPNTSLQPTSFQGGSQAVEDGATIALCLALAGGDADGVGLALETFQRMRRARVEGAQALGRKASLSPRHLPSYRSDDS